LTAIFGNYPEEGVFKMKRSLFVLLSVSAGLFFWVGSEVTQAQAILQGMISNRGIAGIPGKIEKQLLEIETTYKYCKNVPLLAVTDSEGKLDALKYYCKDTGIVVAHIENINSDNGANFFPNISNMLTLKGDKVSKAAGGTIQVLYRKSMFNRKNYSRVIKVKRDVDQNWIATNEHGELISVLELKLSGSESTPTGINEVNAH